MTRRPLFSEEDLTHFPFEIIKLVEMQGKEITITFKSGNGIHATAPDENTFQRFKLELIKNLDADKVIIK